MAAGLTGLALGVFAVWGFVAAHRSAGDFAAHAVHTTATITRIHYGLPMPNESGPSTHDEYADVLVVVDGRPQPAQIRLISNCAGVCLPTFRVGETLHVAYDPQSGRIAFPVPRHGGVDTSGMGELAFIAAAAGAFLLVVAIGRWNYRPPARAGATR